MTTTNKDETVEYLVQSLVVSDGSWMQESALTDNEDYARYTYQGLVDRNIGATYRLVRIVTTVLERRDATA